MSERRQNENYDRKTVRHLAKQVRGVCVVAWCSPVEEPAPVNVKLEGEAWSRHLREHDYSSNGYVGAYTSEHLLVFQLEHADCEKCIVAARDARWAALHPLVLKGSIDGPMQPGTKLEFVPDSDDEAQWAERVNDRGA